MTANSKSILFAKLARRAREEIQPKTVFDEMSPDFLRRMVDISERDSTLALDSDSVAWLEALVVWLESGVTIYWGKTKDHPDTEDSTFWGIYRTHVQQLHPIWWDCEANGVFEMSPEQPHSAQRCEDCTKTDPWECICFVANRVLTDLLSNS
jgi:hypothetical protein